MNPGRGVMSTDYEGRAFLLAPPGGGASHNRLYSFQVQAPKILILLAAVAISCLLLGYYYSSPFQQLTHHNSFSSSTASGGVSQSTTLEQVNDLATILKNAATEDKTVIITTLNKAWAEPNSMFDLFLESFRIGNQTQRLLKHLVVITFDEHAYTRCLKTNSYCYAIDTNGTDFSAEAVYMKPNFLDLVWRRLNTLLSVLELGYNFIFTDTDVMWFRDPLPHFYHDGDFQVSCDHFGGNASAIGANLPNSGFKFVKSNNKSIEFYKFWLAARMRFPERNEQQALNAIIFDPFVNQNGLEIRFLDTAYFGGFCEISKDLNKVCTIHANCCADLNTKIFDLRIMINDWEKYMASQMSDSVHHQYSSWSGPKYCVKTIIAQNG